MVKKAITVFIIGFLAFGCGKNPEESANKRKTDIIGFEGALEDVDEGCNYIIHEPVDPNLQVLIESQSIYTSQQEWEMDFYILLLSHAIHDYANNLCLTEERWEFLLSLSEDNSGDFVLDELILTYPDLGVHIDQYLNSSYGLTYAQIRLQVLQGYTYVPNITIANAHVMDPSLPAFIGAAVEYDVDGISDYAPFRLECEEPVKDYLITRVEDDVSEYDPLPELTCIYNPIIIVNWQLDAETVNGKQKGIYADLGDITEYSGEPYDTLFPNPPAPAPNGCADHCDERYNLVNYNLAGRRYERRGKSEVYISYITARSFPPSVGTPVSHECDKIARIKKSKMGKTHSSSYYLHDFDQNPSMPWNAWQLSSFGSCDVNPTGGFFIGATYERDWYNSHKRLGFDPYTYQGTPLSLYTEISAKYVHEHWQIIFIEESDWCDQEVKVFRKPYGFAKIHAKW